MKKSLTETSMKIQKIFENIFKVAIFTMRITAESVISEIISLILGIHSKMLMVLI